MHGLSFSSSVGNNGVYDCGFQILRRVLSVRAVTSKPNFVFRFHSLGLQSVSIKISFSIVSPVGIS